MSRFAVRPTAHEDRSDVPTWLVAGVAASAALAAGLAGQLGAQGRVAPTTGFAVGAGLALLAIFGLPSLSLRQASRVVVFVSAAVIVRFGLLVGSADAGGQVLLVWLLAATATVGLGELVGAQAVRPLGGEGVAPAPPVRPALRSLAAAAVVVVVVAVVLAPLVLPLVGDSTEVGDGASLQSVEGGAAALRATDSLDMTTRPDNTDEVVFTVEAERAAFWRGETFDVWDGRSWTRSEPRFEPLLPGDELRVGDDDLGARGDDVIEQRVRIETSFAEIVFAAASAVEVEIDRPVRQRPDGTLVSAPMGRGTTYTVTSQREPLSDERLRAVDGGETPAAIAAQYAAEPVMTDRVRELAPTIVEGADTRYDQIRAIEAWMGERVEYTLEAPLAPRDQDVVDHFLFDAEQGWCEQIASSLVVLARANGIPARLVTGFVPGDRDAITGTFTVRERDAHAWAEVWFPEVGWVPFDPTADVPLAGEEPSNDTLLSWLVEHAVLIGVGIVALVLVLGPIRRWVRRRRDRRAAAPTTWAATTDAALVALGARLERPRRVDETATTHAAALAWLLDDARVADVGRSVDDALYAPVPPGPDERARIDALVAELATVERREPVPAGT
jgi:transglutaminase-like putative cysteine protease